MLNECACRLSARLEIRLQFRRILAMDTEKNGKSHIHVNISRNENPKVKSISEETQGASRSGELRVWFIECSVLLFLLF